MRARRPSRRRPESHRSLELLETRVLMTATVESAFSFGSNANAEDRITGMTIDSAGILYVTGHFSGTMDMDPGAAATNLTSNGGQDIFVAAYAYSSATASHALVWAKSFGGAGDETGGDIAFTNNGLVLTGTFRGTVDVDPGTGTTNFTSNGLSDVFISRFTKDGALAWSKTIGGTGTDTAYRLKADANNNLFIVGSFDATIDLDPGAGVQSFAPNSPGGDLFLLKLDGSGSFSFANRYAFSDTFTIANLAIDRNNNVFIAGNLRGGVDIDGSPAATSVTATGTVGYVAKLTNTGALAFYKTFGDGQGSGNDTITVYDVAVDSSSSIIIVGNFGGTIDMDPSGAVKTLTETQSPNAFTGFILKLDNTGGYAWAGALTGDANSDVWTVTTDVSNNVYIAGAFNHQVDFNIKSGTWNITAPNTLNTAFVAQYDSAGNFVWENHASAATAASYATRLVAAPDNFVVAAGYFTNSVTFPTATPTTLTGPNQDNFVLRMKRGFPLPTVTFNAGPETAIAGGPVTLSITLSGTTGVPSGNIIFFDQFNNTSSQLASVALNASGQASLVLSNLAVGSHSFTAIYEGDSNFNIGLGLPKSVNVIINQAPYGNIDSTANGAIVGWAADLDDKNTALVVQLWIDNQLRGNVLASQTRPDLQAAIGATNHGFIFQMPPLDGGAHTVSVVTYDPLTGTPKVVSTRQVISNSLFFDEAWYLRTYPDIAAAVAAGAIGSGWIHYSTRGAKEGRSPSAWFDEMWYRSKYPDVAAAVANGSLFSGFTHFVAAGSHEGRDPSPYFNEMYYRRAYADVGTAVTNGSLSSGFTHFMLAGLMEGRSPSPWFNPAYYRSTYADIDTAIKSGLVRTAADHFANRGVAEKRSPSTLFVEADYLAKYADVAAAVANKTLSSGLAHFIKVGFYEGRQSWAGFDPAYYTGQHPEVSTAITDGTVKSAFQHYLLFGRLQGWTAHA